MDRDAEGRDRWIGTTHQSWDVARHDGDDLAASGVLERRAG